MEAADITGEKGSPKRIGAFAVPKAMSPSATLAIFAPDDEQRFHLRKRQYPESRSRFRRHADLRQRRDNVTLGAVLSNSFGFGDTNASVVFKRLDA